MRNRVEAACHRRPQDANIEASSARLRAGNAPGEAGGRDSVLSQQRPGQRCPTHGAAMTGARARKVASTGPTCSLEELERCHTVGRPHLTHISHLVFEEAAKRRRSHSSVHFGVGVHVVVGHGEIEEHRQNGEVSPREDGSAPPVHLVADVFPIGGGAALILRVSKHEVIVGEAQQHDRVAHQAIDAELAKLEPCQLAVVVLVGRLEFLIDSRLFVFQGEEQDALFAISDRKDAV
eukprot:scaffold49780_cov64-Phaeocystis_antarctica.AAC.1